MSGRPWVLGLSCSHNGAACLMHGDEIVAAIQEERLTRLKRQQSVPRFVGPSVDYCLEAGGIRSHELDLIVCSIIRGVNDDDLLDDIFLNERLRVGCSRVPVLSLSHHRAHAISAFATSGFQQAAVLVIDGSGTFVGRLPHDERAAIVDPAAVATDKEWLSYYEACGTTVRVLWKQVTSMHAFDVEHIERFGSLGEMYGAVGSHLFGDALEGPGKVMGLAPYGKPSIPAEQWFRVDERGVLRFRPDGYRVGRRWRWPQDFDGCADLAASVQHATECALRHIVCEVRRRSSSPHLCYAGGVALNSVANESIVRGGGFEDVFIFPAADDSGVAIGAAYYGVWELVGKNTRRRLRQDALGRSYAAADVERVIAGAPGVAAVRRGDVATATSRLVREGRIVGWFQGGSELGPRALGQRSILCDPTRPDAKSVLNARVKHREAFRPFAPVVLREYVEDWFDVPPRVADSPFMLRVWPFRRGKAATVPAVAHVDDSARVQTITRESHPLLYEVIDTFRRETGVPMLLNTSFNLAGEPIVETPDDALRCLVCTGLDCCVLGDYIVQKREEGGSVLDWCPRLEAAAVTVEIPVNGRPLALDGNATFTLPGSTKPLMVLDPGMLRHFRRVAYARGAIASPVAYATVATRWGERVVLLADPHVRLLARVDGKTSGRELWRPGDEWNSEWVADALAKLYRLSIISFAETARLDREHMTRRTSAVD